jgi:hypothetical protein
MIKYFFGILYYSLLIIVDTIILLILQFLNPYYGSNSGDDMIQLLDLQTRAHDLEDRIKNNHYKDDDNTYVEEYYQILVDAHTHMFNVILNG